MQTSTLGRATPRPAPWGSRSWPWVAAILAIGVFGFWKPYFSRLGTADPLAHLHTGLMLAWFALLLVQPVLVRSRRLALHRRLGRVSWVLVPAIVVTMLAFARQRLQAAPEEAFTFQAYVLYLGLTGAGMFATAWALAMWHRREPSLHARYMAGTALVMLDPAIVRVMIFWLPPPGVQNLQWITYGIVYAILGTLMFLERRQPRGRRAFPVLLGMFVVVHVLSLTLARSGAWLAFARWYAG